MTIIDDTAPEKKGPPLVVQLAVLGALTVAALGIGWGSGLYLNSRQPSAAPTPEAAGPELVEIRLAETAERLGIVYLDPILTNLAGPVEMWVRLEYALVFNGSPDPAIAQAIQQDTLAYLRTVKSHQLEGASGFQHLKADLEERAALRSEGKVKGILIRSLLFE